MDEIDKTNLSEQTKFRLSEIIGIEIIRLSEIFKKLLSAARNKKKKDDKILMLVKSKLDSIETLVSQSLIVIEISYEEFNAIIREKERYERMKGNVGTASGRSSTKNQENMRLYSVNSKKITSL